MNKDLIAIFEYLEREKGIKREVVIHAISDSLQAAARRSVKGLGERVSVEINSKTGEIEVFTQKKIVENVENPSDEISFEEIINIITRHKLWPTIIGDVKNIKKEEIMKYGRH